MFVVDASVAVHALVRPGGEAAMALLVSGDAVAPYLLDIEVVSALRRVHRQDNLTDAQIREAIADYASLPIDRHNHELLLHRIWELRQNITAYDATYVALAEALEMPLLTRDAHLYRSPAHAARIEYIG